MMRHAGRPVLLASLVVLAGVCLSFGAPVVTARSRAGQRGRAVRPQRIGPRWDCDHALEDMGRREASVIPDAQGGDAPAVLSTSRPLSGGLTPVLLPGRSPAGCPPSYAHLRHIWARPPPSPIH